MSNAITLPVVFDDGQTRDVEITIDEADQRHYSVSINAESAGSFVFSADMHTWDFTGELSANEQMQIAGFIQNYTDNDWDN